MSTAYTSLLLFGITLAIGPFNILLKKNNPVSSDLRRDFGIWCALVGITHVVIGIQVHMGNFLLYFFKAVEGADAFVLRSDFFGAANYVGLIATIILLVLLILSNDLSLRILKPKRWKSIQQWSYVLFFLVATHGIMFQIIEKRQVPLVLLLIAFILIPFIIQVAGIKRVLKNKK